MPRIESNHRFGKVRKILRGDPVLDEGTEGPPYEQGRNRRVVDRGQDARLALNACAQDAVLDDAIGQHLDGDIALEPGVLGAVDLAHAARADRAEDLVGAELRSGSQRHDRQRITDGAPARHHPAV